MRLNAALAVAAALAGAGSAAAADLRVADARAFAAAASRAKPGDRILLADGVWRDAALRIDAEGTSARPITVAAEHPGKAILAGRSGLAVAGRWLVVADLVFKDGFAPDKAVVATRVGSRWAEHVRLTGLVIDGFSNPDRRLEDHWLALYGRDIRLDHGHFQGKANNGAMLIVVREMSWPLDNRVRIDHTYFGPRPPLGSNGGETIRIGTSTESMSDSGSVVEDNVFERCDGEVEIISVKSGANLVRRNLFLESQGSVVLRHGNGNMVERNVFLGHGVAHTGGVRVINERQTVRENYMEGLAGEGFTSALTVMNGVPNSPINRYLPVTGAVIARNSVIDSARITLGAGADGERSRPPAASRMADNLVFGSADPFRADADISGIVFFGNVANRAPRVPGAAAVRADLKMARAANGLLYPTDPALAGVGAPRDLEPISRSDVGVPWYPKPAPPGDAFAAGSFTAVSDAAQLRRLVDSVSASPGIRLLAGDYAFSAPLVIRRPLFLAGEDARLAFSSPTLFQLEEGGALRLLGLTITGAQAPSRPGNAVVRSSGRPTLANYAVELIDCRLSDMAGAPGFDGMAATPGTLADHILVRGGDVSDLSGALIAGHAEAGTEGYYAAEQITLDRVTLSRVGAVADIFRGGTDESTYGPRFRMTGGRVVDSGPIRLSGVQETAVRGVAFVRSGGIEVTHSVGEPRTTIAGNSFQATPPPTVRELHHKGAPRAVVADNRVVG